MLTKYVLHVDGKKILIRHSDKKAIDVTLLNDDEIKSLFENNMLKDKGDFFEREKILGGRYYGKSFCIVPSNMCQLKCKYCYSDSGCTNQKKYVDYDKVIKVIDRVFENYKLYRRRENSVIDFLFHGGGEPTENWALFTDIVNYINEKKRQKDCDVYLKIVTNGIMNKEKAEWIADHFNEAVISIDGPEAINDNTRVFRNQKGTTKIVVRTANIIAKKIKVGTHSVVTGLSKECAREIVSFIKEEIKCVNYISFQKYRKTDHGRNQAFEIDASDYLHFVLEAYHCAPELVRSTYLDFAYKKSFCKGCTANRLFLFPNGNLTTCNEHDLGVYAVGECDDKGIVIKENWYAAYKESVYEKLKELNCEECFAFPFCRGGCHSHYLESRNFSEEWCYTYKSAISKIISEKIGGSPSGYIYHNDKILPYLSLSK